MWLDSILSGITGAVLASAFTILYSARVDQRKELQSKKAHSFSLISALEAYTINCADYIDTAHEQLSHTYHSQDTGALSKLTTPKFEVPNNVDFKPIDSNVASRVLTLPFLVRRSEEIALSAFIVNDIIDAIETSIRQCGIRGLTAWKLAEELRQGAGIQPPEFDPDWDFLNTLQKAAEPTPTEPFLPPSLPVNGSTPVTT